MKAETEIKENPYLCYQCAKCSAGCPVAEKMEILPHQIMHYLSIGMEDRVLKANTIWMCAGCFTCSVRCPNDIDITSVMDDLRKKSIQQGISCPVPDVLTFHNAFIKAFAGRGRVHELRMMTEFNLRTGNPFHNIKLAPKMLLKKRLHVLPPKSLKGFKSWMKKIWKH
ncbi:MAG: heterodisulfide reductase subunit C [Candidatus Latescibacteria bacterium]|nr:heterodisulfide reductase subunit C [Candidatus Latescibacterota bacterium]